MVADYYLVTNGIGEGPFSYAQIQAMVDNGEVRSEDLYAREGWKGPRKLGLDFKFPAPQWTPRNPPTKSLAAWGPFEVFCGAGAVVTLLIFLVWLNKDLSHGVSSESRASSYDAHSAAEDFVKRSFPGADKISSMGDSVVQQDGDTYLVGVVVDGKNAFGGPIRKMVGVEMEKVGDKWRLKHIEQR